MIIPNRDTIKTVAAVHQQDSSCRVVVATIRSGSGGSGAGLGADIEITLAETVSLAGGPGMFTSLIERAGEVDAIIRVLPAACTVVRIAGIPESGDGAAAAGDAVADALSLMAETELPTAVPSYRRAAGIINPGRGGSRRAVGLLAAWPTSADLQAAVGLRTPRVAPEVGISEAGALAILAQLAGGVDRAWTVDRAGGAMTILATGPDKTVARVVRTPSGDAGETARRAALAETSRAAGIAETAATSSDSSWVHLEPAPGSVRIAGQQRSAEWIASYGLASAAIIAFADGNRAVAGLVELHEAEPKAKPPILQRITEWAGSPRWAAAIITLCVLVVVGLPIGAAYARMRILEKHVTDQDKLFTQNSEDERTLAFYRLLREKRWPMTKLLSDIAGACPEGISMESIELAQGESVVLRGTAEDTGKLSTFRENLEKTKVFASTSTPSVNPTGSSGVQFQLTAKVPPNAATLPVKPIDDWAAKSLSERMYGEKSTKKYASRAERPAARGDRTDKADRTDRTDRTDRRSSTSSRPSNGSTRDSGRDTSTRNDRASTSSSAAKPPAVIPAPISDADIAKLTVEQSIKEFSSRKLASTGAGVDEATKRRLLDEYEKIKAHKSELDSKGGGK